MIRLPAGEVLRQIGIAVRQHEPDKTIELPYITSWTEGIQKATAAIQGTDSEVFLIHPHTRHQKEIFRQIALENVRQNKEAPERTLVDLYGQPTICLLCRTPRCHRKRCEKN